VKSKFDLTGTGAAKRVFPAGRGSGGGFTLVELSIVLIIIGVIAGGIIVAKSMIQAARVEAVVRQIQQYDAAVANFQTKYGGLPGDSTVMGCVDGVNNNVCGNGIIGDDGNSSPKYFKGETANFWPNLQVSGFTYPQTFTPVINGTFNASPTAPNAPVIAASNPGSVIAAYWYHDNSKNVYLSGDWTGLDISGAGANTISDTKFIFRPEMALAIDTKMDDGQPGSGKVSVWKETGACDNTIGSQYDVDTADATCDLSFEMNSQNGGQ